MQGESNQSDTRQMLISPNVRYLSYKTWDLFEFANMKNKHMQLKVCNLIIKEFTFQSILCVMQFNHGMKLSHNLST